MATVKAPLFGLDASGALGGSIVYSIWRGRAYVRRLAIPANPKSVLQIGMRSVFKWITQDFTNLTAAQKAAWDALAAGDNITQLNAQVRDAQKRARINQGWRRGPAETANPTIDPPTVLVTTAQNKSLVLSWTRPVANQGEYTAGVYLRTTTGLTGLIQELQIVQVVTDITVTVTGLVNGTGYFWVVRETNFDGELGTVSAEGTGTPAA